MDDTSRQSGVGDRESQSTVAVVSHRRQSPSSVTVVSHSRQSESRVRSRVSRTSDGTVHQRQPLGLPLPTVTADCDSRSPTPDCRLIQFPRHVHIRLTTTFRAAVCHRRFRGALQDPAWARQAAPASALAPGGAAAGEAFWKSVRDQFVMPPDLAVMNAANLCPASRPALETLQRETRRTLIATRRRRIAPGSTRRRSTRATRWPSSCA